MSFHNITPFSGGMPTFCAYLSGHCPAIQFFHCCFDPIQRVSSFQPTGTSVSELSSLPHALFNFADLFLIYKEEARRLAKACDCSGEQEVVNVFQHVVKPHSLISTILETPEIVLCIPRSFSLIMVRECIQGSVMNDLLLLVVRPRVMRRVLKTTDLNEEDKDTEGQHSDQDLRQYKDKDVEQPNDGSCT